MVFLPYETEACGLKEAIIWLGDMGMSNVSIELDYKLVVDGILDKSTNKSEFGKIMSDCKMLFSNYPNFKISFIKQQANFIAHFLARASKLYASYHIFDYISSLPSYIFTILMNEIIRVCSCKKDKNRYNSKKDRHNCL